MSTTDRGQQAEDLCVAALEAAGYQLVDQAFQRIRSRWSTEEGGFVKDEATGASS